ncbi:MAG: hypothetical protein M3R46_18025 [Actinomycetota bacterium]|nr:hypothetical protein [Actinomycetota bacterium]
MARDERLHGRGRLETNLVRLPLAEGNDHLRDVRPFVGEALLGGFRTTIRLKQLDLMVLAFVLERWWWQSPDRDSCPAEFTLRELGQAVYGRRPAGHERRLLRCALARLYEVSIDFVGFDAATRETGARWGRARLIQAIGGALGELGDFHALPPAEVLGGLRGSTFAVELASWLAEQVRAGNVTYLDFAVMRRLNGLAQRLWMYLQAERYSGRGETWVALGPRMYEILGMGYGRERDARQNLRLAARRITEADERYELIDVQRRVGWGITARRAASSERRQVRAAIGERPHR